MKLPLEDSGHTPQTGIVLFQIANLPRNQGSHRDNEIALKKRKSCRGEEALEAEQLQGSPARALLTPQDRNPTAKTALQEHEVIPPLQPVFSCPISYSGCEREKGKEEKKIQI